MSIALLPSTILRKALALMNDNGSHWTKGYFSLNNEEDDFSFCSAGAINHIVTGSYTDDELSQVTDQSRAAIYALANAIREKTGLERLQYAGLRLYENDEAAINTIATWNDDKYRTWDHIVSMFNRAAGRKEELGR